MKLATSAQMKELDRRAIEERKIPSIDLMERAATGITQTALGLLPDRPGKCRISVLCGAGNNGGDGIAAARLLAISGAIVRIFLVGQYEKLTPDALIMTARLSDYGMALEPFDPTDETQRGWIFDSHVLIDALFGVGLSREIAEESNYAKVIRWMNESRAKIVAADIASGVEADTGRVLGCAVHAEKTVTFTLKKIGQAVSPGDILSGDVEILDIGIPASLVREVICPVQTVEAEFVQSALPARKLDGHKGDFGKLLAVGGAVGYTGAPYLMASAAVKMGCGLVFLGVPEAIWTVETLKCSSAMPFPLEDQDGKISEKALDRLRERLKDCKVLALGPGLGRGEQITQLVCTLLQETEQPVVLDADGINALEGHIDILDKRQDQGRVTILTPHDIEFSRIGGDLTHGDRVRTAREFAIAHKCVLVLKGHRTITALPQGNVLVNTTGNSGLAKGGSGDVLTGIIAALLAQGASPVQAAAGGVWLHGRAGELASEYLTEYCVSPEDIISTLPEAIREIL